MKNLLLFFGILLMPTMLFSQKTQPDSAKKWLESLFKCQKTDRSKFCFYSDNEEQIMTKRFYDYLSESLSLYGYDVYTEKDRPVAEKKYKEKWKSIYPLQKREGENWLFGRGNGGLDYIKDLKISKISNLKYNVNIVYNADYRTDNVVTLIKTKTGYKIDYCKTTSYSKQFGKEEY